MKVFILNSDTNSQVFLGKVLGGDNVLTYYGLIVY